MIRTLFAFSLLFSLAGCITSAQNPALPQPVTYQDLATTQPSYWMGQPAIASVTSDNFENLWAAAEQVDRNFLFRLDRQDYRSGILTTIPLVSSQWFEFWRFDVHTRHDWEESSLATIRRTIEFDFTDNGNGTYTTEPKVIVERRALAEIRITSVTSYSRVFVQSAKAKERASGTEESDLGANLPQNYWYALGRDEAFERVLANAVEEELKQPTHGRLLVPATRPIPQQ